MKKSFMVKKSSSKKQKVLVAMSGGVDSSLVAALLVKQGYDVTGAFIKNWSDTKDLQTGECEWRHERRDAIRVAASLGISFLTFDFEKQYRKLVVDELFRGYKAGITPNPDVLCNEYVKFGLFWSKAKQLGFDLMATGHYAASSYVLRPTSHVPRTTPHVGRLGRATWDAVRLFRGVDKDKDQSYFLYRINQEALAHTLFPLGKYTKSQVRALAKKMSLPVAEKPDSQGICFIGKVDFGKFLAKKIKSKPGDIVTPEGKTIGRHQGLHNYTIGQRHKIKVADKHAWFVAEKDVAANKLVVVPSDDHPLLKTKRLILTDLHWIAGAVPKIPLDILVQARYRQSPEVGCVKSIKSGKLEIVLKKPIKSVAPGQSAVLYKGKECLGGGIITQIERL
jgi:tRNA-specific 2-thiouridylase